MEHFGAYSPVLGLRRDFPSVFLNKLLLPDGANVRFYKGEIQSAMMRSRELVEAVYSTGTLTAASGSAVLTGSGTAWHSGLEGRRITVFEGNWSSPTSIIDPDSDWTNEDNIKDGNVATSGQGQAQNDGWKAPLETYFTPAPCSLIRFYPQNGTTMSQVRIHYKAEGDTEWTLLYSGSFTSATWNEKSLPTDIQLYALKFEWYSDYVEPTPSIIVLYEVQAKMVLEYEIDEVSSATSLTLTGNYNGAGGSDLEYSIGTIDPTTKVASPDGYPFIKYHRHIGETGTEYLLGFTKEHIYRWHTETAAWYEMFEGSTCSTWGVVSFQGRVIATNNVAIPQYWDGSTDDFVNLGDPSLGPLVASGVGITRAKAVTIFENHVVFGNYATSNGETYPYSCVCSALGDELDWFFDGTTDATNWLVDGIGSVVGFGIKNELLYVFKERSIRIYWYTGTTSIFASRNYNVDVGCAAYDSIVNDSKTNLYWYASDLTFREVDLGVISAPIIDIALTLNQAQLDLVKSAYIPEYDEVWWAVPHGTDVILNNKILCYADRRWSPPREITVTAFGKWSRQTTWDWASLYIYDNWEDWNWTDWLAAEGTIGFPMDLCSDEDGHTYLVHAAETDDGVAFSHNSVISTDLADGGLVRYYKRLLRILVYVRNEGKGALDISIKRDNESGWQSAGSVNLSGDNDILIQELPVDFRAKNFLIKAGGSDKSRVLGYEFDYEIAGLR